MMSEAEMVRSITALFEADDYLIAHETPMLSKFIDLVAFRPHTDELVAVEAKVKNWKRAFQQALTYQLCSDRTYIAIHTNYAQRIDLGRLAEYGLGLITVDETGAKVVLAPQRNTNFHQPIKAAVSSYVRGERSG